jgi:hypothetical protein
MAASSRGRNARVGQHLADDAAGSALVGVQTGEVSVVDPHRLVHEVATAPTDAERSPGGSLVDRYSHADAERPVPVVASPFWP